MPRKKQRLQVLESEIENAIDHHIQEKVLESKFDNELFVLDNQGSKNAKQRIAKEIVVQTQLSKGEKKRLNKATIKKSVQQKEIEKNQTADLNLYDIWNNNSNDNIVSHQMKTRVTAKNVVKKRSIASLIKPGLSYNPAVDQHQDVLHQALTLEKNKIEKENQKKLLVLNALPTVPATLLNSSKAFLVTHDEFSNINQDDDDEDDSDSDEDIQDGTGTNEKGIIKKQKSKLTRAERNKKRDRKQRLFKESQEKQKLSLLKDLNVLPNIVQQIKKKENKSNELKIQKKKELVLSKKQAEISAKLLSYEEAGQIPLSDELNGSLRQLIPKGNPTKDMMVWKVKTGEAMPKERRKRRAYEKPHGKSNVKWIQAVK